MSATYRIELRRDPHSSALPWDALIYQLSDDAYLTTVHGRTTEIAMDAARAWIRDENDTPHDGFEGTYWADDQGRDAEAPQSVRV